MSDFPSCELWDFSLAVYGRDGVAPACLALQERHGTDVNLLLFDCWVGASGRGTLNTETAARVRDAVKSWHADVVRGLRKVRKRLKRDPGPATAELVADLRKRIGAIELETEHVEQLLLSTLAPPQHRNNQPSMVLAADAARNAVGYLAWLGAVPDAADRSDLLAILRGGFPELAPNELEAALDTAWPGKMS